MKHGSLFSGIGGFDLAAEWMGWENVFHCEWMEFPRKVLDYYWPDADSHVDICKTDFTKYANTIDILTGGFPCQPFSLAGKRKGTDDERYLWHEMLRAIREIKPKWVIAENVFGIVNIDGGMVFEQVCLDLEAEGYEVQPFIIPAAAKNAPHRRDRCWFVAYSNRDGSNQCNCNNEINASEGRINALGNAEQGNGNGDATDTEHTRLEGHNRKWEGCTEYRNNKGVFVRSKDKFINTDTNSWGIQTWSQREVLEQSNRQTSKRFINVERRNQWQNFPTQSPICGGDDGLPTKLDGITFPKWRNESIKGYGNAIVPQIALQLFQIIEHESKNQNT
jgi:DNA (cytosine-5)-methyltransferase 1